MPLLMHLYLISIILTILISVSSSNWFMVWAMMEINLMMFIPFLCSKKHLTDSSPVIKYFLAQVMGSILLILFILLMVNESNFSMITGWNSCILISAMAIKSGTPPFHFWFPQLIEVSNWIQMSLLLVLQKIIPLVFLFYCVSQTFMVIIIISGLVGCMGGFNQNSMKKIIAYSSMTHMGWILLSMTFNVKSSLVYFTVYSLMTLSLVYFLSKSSMTINSSSSSKIFSKYENFNIFVLLLSISGVPPFSGFFIKMMVIEGTNSGLFIILLMVLFSLVSMVYYLRMSYSMLIDKSGCIKTKATMKNYSKLLVTSVSLVNLISPCLIVYLT